MIRLTGTNSLRITLLAAGVSLGASAMLDPSALQSTVVAAEDLAKDAATVEEIAKTIDLQAWALPEGAKVVAGQSLGNVFYETTGDIKSAMEFQKKQFMKMGWKELPGSKAESTYHQANYQKSTFVVSVMCYAAGMPDKKSSQVSISNLGNVKLSKLPVVKGAKTTHSSDTAVAYVTDLKSADAGEAIRNLLEDSGWEPFGSPTKNLDSVQMTFKRNAIQLSVFAGAHPAQAGKVLVSYNSSVLAADIPAPPNAADVRFGGTGKTLFFSSPDGYDAVAKFYQQRLAKAGWKPTTDELSDFKGDSDRPIKSLVFRNAAKDVLTLKMDRASDKTQGNMTHETAAEVAEANRRMKAAVQKGIAANKAREDAAEAELVAAKQAAKKQAAKLDDAFPDVDALIKETVGGASKKSATKSDDGVPDVDSLIKGAVGGALKDSGIDLDQLTKGAKGTAKNNAATANDVVGIPVLADAKKVTQTSDNVLQIKFPAGKGKAAAELIRDQLRAAEWELDDGEKLTAKSGNLTLKKRRQQITMSYVDTGFTDVTVMLIGIGTKLTEGKVDPNAKVPAKTEARPAKPTAKSKPKSDDDDEPRATPARREKPTKGIAKLSKLPNEGKVVVNNEPVGLPHVIACEYVSQGKWVTRIFATERPIKQSSLIDWMKKAGKIEDLEISSPNIQLELDNQDRPNTLSLVANKTPGGTGSSGLKGEAIVEEGRARGSFKMTESKEFFDRTIIGEISFDIPVLTRDSKPAKQLTDAPKLENSGKLLVNGKPIKLGSLVAYEVKVFDEKRTAIFFTEKPINLAKLKASLAKDGSDSGLFESQSQVKIEIDKDDRVSSMNLYSEGASLNSNAELIGDVIVEDGRARGTARLGKPTEFFGKTFSFEMTFDVDVLPLAATPKE